MTTISTGNNSYARSNGKRGGGGGDAESENSMYLRLTSLSVVDAVPHTLKGYTPKRSPAKIESVQNRENTASSGSLDGKPSSSKKCANQGPLTTESVPKLIC